MSTLPLKVLVADQFSLWPSGMDDLKSAGIELLYNTTLRGDALSEMLAEEQPEVLVVRSTKVHQEIIESNKNL